MVIASKFNIAEAKVTSQKCKVEKEKSELSLCQTSKVNSIKSKRDDKGSCNYNKSPTKC